MTNREAAWVLKHIETHNDLAEEAKQLAIRALEAADRETERRAKWVQTSYSIRANSEFECSNCKARVWMSFYDPCEWCPKCGAHMIGAEDIDDDVIRLSLYH